MKIIGFAGLGRGGKTTAADAAAAYLLDNGFTPVMERFAGPLKDASAMLGFHKDGDTDHLYREFCQFAGRKAREQSDDWWARLLVERVAETARRENEELEANPNNGWHERVLIIDDVRYPNEVECIHSMGGKVIFVSSARRLAGELDEAWRKHESEALATGYEQGRFPDDLFDFSISNNDPSEEGLVLFTTTIGPLVHKIVTSAREETQ